MSDLEGAKKAADDGAVTHGTPAADDHATPGKSKPQIAQKSSFDLPEYNFGNKDGWSLGQYVKAKPFLKGKITVETVAEAENGKTESSDVTVGVAASKEGVGGKADLQLGKQKGQAELMGIHLDGELKEKLSFQLGSDKLDISGAVESRVAVHDWPHIKGGVDAKFILLGAKWEDIQKDPNKIKMLAVEIGGAVQGEKVFDVGGTKQKVSVQANAGVAVQPNWAKIAARIAQEAAAKGAQTAATGAGATATATGAGATATGAGATATGAGATATGAGATTTASGTLTATSTPAAATATAAGATASEGLVFSGAATASGIAAIALPLAAGAMMIAGGMQMEKNKRASLAAVNAGVAMRDYVRGYMKSYMKCLSGGSNDGHQGAQEANVRVLEAMDKTGLSREEACKELIAANGGYSKIQGEIMKQALDLCYSKAIVKWEAASSSEFGLLESLGETWGCRGTFRRDLKMVLYSDLNA